MLILSTSTCGTLTALALHESKYKKMLSGLFLFHPTLGVNNGAVPMLTLPAARYRLPLLVGKTVRLNRATRHKRGNGLRYT